MKKIFPKCKNELCLMECMQTYNAYMRKLRLWKKKHGKRQKMEQNDGEEQLDNITKQYQMMNKLIISLLLFSMAVTACTQKTTNMNKFLEEKILDKYTKNERSYDHEFDTTGDFVDVEMYKLQVGDKVFETTSFMYQDILAVRKVLEESDFKPLAYSDFRKKILKLYHIDMDTTYCEIIAPTIDADHVTDVIVKSGFLMNFNGGWGDFDPEALVMYNKMILNDDTLAFNWMKVNRPYEIIGQVKEIGVTSNSKWLKFAFDNTNFWKSDFELHDYIFGGNIKDGKYYLRKDMLDSMIVHGVDMSLLSNEVQAMEYAKKTNDPSYGGDYDDMIGFLYRKLSQVGQFGIIESRLDNEPQFKNYLKEHNYFDDEYIRSFCEETYKSPVERKKEGRKSSLSPYPNYYINDKDGYTNMRSAPSSNAAILTTIPHKERIDVTERSENGWWKVCYNGHTGYVHKSRIVDFPVQ